jgi:uncharacterized membrane protein YqjE
MANGDMSVSVVESARRLVATLLAIVETRLGLFSTDLQDATRHVVWLILGGVVAVFFLSLGFVLVALLVVAFFWDTHRMTALGITGGFFFAISFFIVAMLFRSVRQHRSPFAATLGELAKDRRHLESSP